MSPIPYITYTRRTELLAFQGKPAGPGELNFMITRLLVQYLKDHGQSYSNINDCLGALEGAKLEFYRRAAVLYEEAKMAQNGDVY